MQVVIAPDERLRIQTKPVLKITPGLLQTFREMIKLTKSFHDPEGVGLASTQVGLDSSFFISFWENSSKKPTKPIYKIIINPKILSQSSKTKFFFEGCLSIPNMWGEIERPISVSVEYQDETGKVIKERLTGLKAHIFQHEVDHLNGIIFTQKVLEQKGKFYKWMGKDKTTKEDIFQEVIL